jgi:hypothetical protein
VSALRRGERSEQFHLIFYGRAIEAGLELGESLYSGAGQAASVAGDRRSQGGALAGLCAALDGVKMTIVSRREPRRTGAL